MSRKNNQLTVRFYFGFFAPLFDLTPVFLENAEQLRRTALMSVSLVAQSGLTPTELSIRIRLRCRSLTAMIRSSVAN